MDQKLPCVVASACTASNSSNMVQMHKARSTWAVTMAARMAGKSASSSGALRWQWESVNMEKKSWMPTVKRKLN